MATFSYPDDMILNRSTHKTMKYDKDISFLKNIHIGQLKLFSNELEFLLSFACDSNIDTVKKIILYIGAGPGDHLVILAKMFSTFEFHLFDAPDRFTNKKLPTVSNVKIHKRYFTEEDVVRYTEMNKSYDLYLISDIRDLSYKGKNWDISEELKVFDDMELQKSWIEAIKPKFSMIKLRLPFPEPEVLFKLGDSVSYLDGIIYKQPWARGKSAESRLIIPGDSIKLVKYSLTEYESQMFYHNAVLRQKEYKFPFSETLNGKVISKKLTVNKRYDCAFTISLLHQYFVRSSKELTSDYTIEKKIVRILQLLTNY